MANTHNQPTTQSSTSFVTLNNAAATAQKNSLYGQGSLYVGDLNADVTEALLFEIFNRVGPVSSIRVCRDATTRRSLGYAYVNFHTVTDAERALSTMNFHLIKGRQCRIMWSNRNPASRRNVNSNIFVKNLDKAVDNKTLFDTFSPFGNILSCKVATDDANRSRGYGFVQYETEANAEEAIKKFDGQSLEGKRVSVQQFIRRDDRASAPKSFTNVYVKFIPKTWDEAKMSEVFGKFGQITSLRIQTNTAGERLGFGFVNFSTHEEALQAVEEGVKIETGDERNLVVCRFQSRSERRMLLSKEHEARRQERAERFKNLNLYVKNLDETVSDETLKEWFGAYGEVTSAVVMKDESKASRGFGFVCFAKTEDATKALNELNGKMMGTKPLYVNRAQRKEERRILLDTQFQTTGPRAVVSPMYFPAMSQQGMIGYPNVINRRYHHQPVRGYHPVYPVPMGRGQNPQHNRPRRSQQHHHQPQQQVAVPPVPPPFVEAQPAELSTYLATQPQSTHKQILGERLFPLVQEQEPERAGKITGMLLEMDVSEVLTIIEEADQRRERINEAVEILKNQPAAENAE